MSTRSEDAHLPITRCPHCKTAFRIREAQLTQRRGMVRCGACRGVFNAIQHMLHQTGNTITITPPPEEGLPPGYGSAPAQLNPLTLIPGRDGTVEPSADASSSRPASLPVTAVQSSTGAAVASVATAGAAPSELKASATPEQTPAPVSALAPTQKTKAGPLEPDREISTDELEAKLEGREHAPDAIEQIEQRAARYEWRQQEAPRAPWVSVLWGALAFVLSLSLVGQVVFHFRNEMVGRFARTRPILQAACDAIGCKLAAPVRRESVVIDGTELVPDAAHAGLHVLTGVLRNRNAYPSAYPALVLTLTGLNNELQTRRVFAPGEYLGALADLKNGLPGNGEMEFKLFLDASAIKPVGFDVRVTYDDITL